MEGGLSEPEHSGSVISEGVAEEEVYADDASLGESSEEETHGFLDIEASEADDSDEEDASLESEDLEDQQYWFPQFSRLPVELRHRIWDFFDPYMRAPTRVYDFRIAKDGNCYAAESATLERQTASARALMATHHESRALALRFYPDTVFFNDRTSVVRCNKDKDVILLSRLIAEDPEPDWYRNIGILDGVKHLAIAMDHDEDGMVQLDTLELPPPEEMEDLETILYCQDAKRSAAQDLRWCVANTAHQFYVETEEESPGVGEDLQYMYCWPNPSPSDDDSAAITVVESEFSTDNAGVVKECNGWDVWPMIQFSFETGIRRYDRIKRVDTTEGEWDEVYASSSDDSQEYESEENEYESEGIDDATIDESDGSGDDEDDLRVVHSSQNDIESLSEGGSAGNGKVDGTSDNDLPAAAFSSLEPESPVAEEDSDSDGPPRRGVTRLKRKVLSDSEDDDEVRESKRHAGRRARVVVSESEDEAPAGDVLPGKAGKTSQLVESEDDDDEEEDEEDEEEDEETEEEEEEEQERRKPSLAERIGLFRPQVPAEKSDSDGSEGGYDDSNDDNGLHESHAYSENSVEGSENDEILDVGEEESEDEAGGW
ncbi:hypothetical protein BX600DRAFT_549539 [Xylariales sp. PMI_506]|nr:hypothetical protein BX600DRAFT_549539 [Xylariales sp. PMI_506]